MHKKRHVVKRGIRNSKRVRYYYNGGAWETWMLHGIETFLERQIRPDEREEDEDFISGKTLGRWLEEFLVYQRRTPHRFVSRVGS